MVSTSFEYGFPGGWNGIPNAEEVEVLTRIKDTLREAMDLQVEGELARAETIYQALLDEDPDNHDALHLLGLLRMQQDQTSTAIGLINRAIALRADEPAFHHNIAGLYRRCGRVDEARAAYREALRLKPDYGEACQGLVEIINVDAITSHSSPDSPAIWVFP